MQTLVELLIEKNLSIASIESLTAGLFAASIAAIPHASHVLKGALVTYQTTCKEELLHIDKNLIDTYGVISKEVADAMASAGINMFHSDICVSFTGNAGPDVMDDKEVGLVHMAICFKGKLVSLKRVFKGNRNEIRTQVVSYMEKEIIKLVKN